jgi:hypothetical protein
MKKMILTLTLMATVCLSSLSFARMSVHPNGPGGAFKTHYIWIPGVGYQCAVTNGGVRC